MREHVWFLWRATDDHRLQALERHWLIISHPVGQHLGRGSKDWIHHDAVVPVSAQLAVKRLAWQWIRFRTHLLAGLGSLLL